MKSKLQEFRFNNDIRQNELASYLNVSSAFISQIERGTRAIPQNLFDKLINNPYGWDISVLESKAPCLCVEAEEKAENLSDLIPVLPVYAHAGTLSDFICSVKKDECEMTVSPVAGVDMIIPICGDSMSPEYPNGSRIAIKKINENAFIEWGKVYVLDTTNGVVIKEIRKGQDDSTIECVSLNPEPKYAPFIVDKKDIIGMYRIVMLMALK